MRTEDRRHEYVEIERVWIAEDGKEFHDGIECLKYEQNLKNPPKEKFRFGTFDFESLNSFAEELEGKNLFYTNESPKEAVNFFQKDTEEKIRLGFDDEYRYDRAFYKDCEDEDEDEDEYGELKHWYVLMDNQVVSLLTIKEKIEEFIDAINDFENKIPSNKNNQKA